MNSISKNLEGEIKNYQDDAPVLDAFYVWSQNPTSMSAGYGVEENYDYIEETLNKRYSVEESERALRIVRGFMDDFLKDDMVGEVRKEIKDVFEKIDFDEKLKAEIIDRIKELSEKEKKKVFLFVKLAETIFHRFREDEGLRLRLSKNQFKTYDLYEDAVFENKLKIPDFFIRLGVINKLYWIKSSNNPSEIRYIVPEYLKSFLSNFEENIHFEYEKPDLEGFIDTLFEEDKVSYFEELLFEGYGKTESNIGISTDNKIIYKTDEGYIISPFIQKELKKKYIDRRRERLKENEKVQNLLNSLDESLRTIHDRKKPKSDLIEFKLFEKQLSYQAHLSIEEKETQLVLTDYLSFITRQYDFSNEDLLIITDQNIPPAQRQLNEIIKSINAVLIHENVIYGLTPLPSNVKEILSELLNRGYELKDVEIEDVDGADSKESFTDRLDKRFENGFYDDTVSLAGRTIEKNMQKLYNNLSQEIPPEKNDRAKKQVDNKMSDYGLGQWIGHFKISGLFEILEEKIEASRNYVTKDYLNKLNDIYVDVKHHGKKPSKQEAMEVLTIAKNVYQQTKKIL